MYVHRNATIADFSYGFIAEIGYIANFGYIAVKGHLLYCLLTVFILPLVQPCMNIKDRHRYNTSSDPPLTVTSAIEFTEQQMCHKEHTI